MKRFIFSVLGFIAIVAVLLFVSVFVLPDHHLCSSLIGVQRQKLDQLSRIEGRKIVVVGGSNVGCGFNSSVISRELGLPVYNMGLHAGFGLIYHMRSVEEYLRDGDVVVLAPEYDMFDSESCFGQEELLALVTAIVPEHRRLITSRHWSYLVRHMPRYGSRKLLRVNGLWRPIKTPKGYDSNGDNQGWRSQNERLPFVSSGKIGADHYSPNVIPYIKGFCDRCQKKGVKVIIIPPVIERTSFENSKEFIYRIVAEMSSNGMPFIVDPEKYSFPDDCFYDTRYHMNAKGVPARMQSLVEDLREML